MKYQPIDKRLFETNRKNFMSRMVPKSIAVFNSNDQYPVGADTLLPFEQHRDIFISVELIKRKVFYYYFPTR